MYPSLTQRRPFERVSCLCRGETPVTITYHSIQVARPDPVGEDNRNVPPTHPELARPWPL